MTEHARVLVTGATGFIGSALVCALAQQGVVVTAATRRPAASASPSVRNMVVGALSANTHWAQALAGQTTVVHCAARAHVMQEAATDPKALYREVNVLATLHLARQAVAAGVRRFIFISTIKVNGERTGPGQPFTACAKPGPQDAYAETKCEAEQGLQALAAETGLELVIIRPPLVYGPGVKGNFLALLQLVKTGVPLPFGRVDNRRSMVALPNLLSLIGCCVDHPAASGQVFLVKDGQDFSTTELLRALARALGRPSRLFPVPQKILYLSACMIGQRLRARRFLQCLQVDDSATRERLNWAPPLTAGEALVLFFGVAER